MSLEELLVRLRKGILGPTRGVILSTAHYSIDDVRRILNERGISSMIEVHLVKPRIPRGAGSLIVIRLREEACERKCEERCGAREPQCYGDCLYTCLESLQEVMAEKLGVIR